MNDEDRLTVVNVVASTRVAEELDLPDIAIQLNCEYEPEQFPGVVYRVSDPKLAILMFRSGRAVCTGGKDEDYRTNLTLQIMNFFSIVLLMMLHN